MSQYKVRSRDLVDIVNDINAESLILSPFFQRNLVWRLAHKVDFIKTILLGYPFPEIFVSRGTLDVETMQSTSCIVDGQQRMNAIREFIEGKFDVDGRFYADLSPQQKETFLKYEVAIIDLDMPQDDPNIIEIFKRLNRTFYALSNIEKLSTEYGSSEFMLVAKLLCGELKSSADEKRNVTLALHKHDPNVTEEFTEWANKLCIKDYLAFILDSAIFTKYEISRQVHLMFTLNIMATLLVGVYPRNEQVVPHLDTYADSFDEKGNIIDRLNRAAELFVRLNFSATSYWFSKSNAFSLFTVLDDKYHKLTKLGVRSIKNALLEFSENVPEDYALSAREAVNNKRQRILRAKYIEEIMDDLTNK